MAVSLQEGMSVTLSYTTFQIKRENVMRKREGSRIEIIQCLSKEEADLEDLLEYLAV